MIAKRELITRICLTIISLVLLLSVLTVNSYCQVYTNGGYEQILFDRFQGQKYEDAVIRIMPATINGTKLYGGGMLCLNGGTVSSVLAIDYTAQLNTIAEKLSNINSVGGVVQVLLL